MPERKLTKIKGPEGQDLMAEDLDYKALKEPWSEYELADGTIIKLRLVVQKISRALTPDGKKTHYKEDGEPLYSIKFQNVASAAVPERLLKKG